MREQYRSVKRGWSTELPRFHLRDSVSRAGDELSAQIADAQAPFWRHVRDAPAKRGGLTLSQKI